MSETRPGYLLSTRQTVLAFVGVMLGMLVAALNQTIVVTALPTIVSDLGGANHYSWVFSAYMLGATVTVPVYGRLSDIYGRRRFFVLGIVIFVFGGVVGATADSMTQLIVARGIQGLGAGALIPLAVIVIGDLVPPADRGRWQGLTGATFGLASVLGPFTGGWIVDHTSWRWVFIASMPVALVALSVGWRTLKIPIHPDVSRTVDWLGAVLLMAGVSLTLLATVWGGTQYPWGSAQIVGLYAAGAALLGWFAWQERRAHTPIVPVRLFKRRTFTLANAAALSVGSCMFGAIMFVPLFVQGAIGASATNSGVVLTPLMLSLMTTSVLSGQIVSRTGRYRWALLTGPVVIAAGFFLLSSLDAESTTRQALMATVVLGLGLGLLLQNLVLVVQNTSPARSLGAATGSTQFFRSIGGTVGVTVMGAILSSGLPAGASTSLGEVGSGAADTLAARQSLADAIHPVFVIGIPLMALTLMLVSMIPETPLRRGVRDEVPLPEPQPPREESASAAAQAA
jgi:EmrB/QacA subfamily drug resistance transporter